MLGFGLTLLYLASATFRPLISFRLWPPITYR